MRRRKAANLDFQKFEDRICLTVAAGVTDAGSLFIRGMADGPVEVVAVGENSFRVSDNGDVIGTFENVDHNISIKLDQNPDVAQDDVVHVHLRNQAVDNVAANLGNGNNEFRVGGDTTIHRVIYSGGRGDDAVTVNVNTDTLVAANMRGGNDSLDLHADAHRVRFHGGSGGDTLNIHGDANAGLVAAGMGHGENAVNHAGTVRGNMHIRSGLGNDTIRVGGDARVGGSLAMNMGHGDNTLNLAGDVGGRLRVRAGTGNDIVNITPSAQVGHNAGMILGHGDNTFNVGGTFGENVFMRGESGNDDVQIGESARIRGSVATVLGAGDNTFDHAGHIGGNLIVVSKNADDLFTISGGTVDGHIRLDPGGQRDRGDS